MALAEATLALTLALAGAPAELRWDFDQVQEVEGVRGLLGAKVSGGALKGLSRWDPYFYLALPAAGINATDYRLLEVRLFSSAPADLLDIYYRTARGYWCLGGTLPVKAGWAVYRVDLEKNHWRETHWPEAKKWGGPDGRVVALRLDPGNEAGRWVMVDWVRLSGQSGETALEIQPRVKAQRQRVSAPRQVQAGQRLPVSLVFQVTAPAGQAPGGGPTAPLTAYARLESSNTLVAWTERQVVPDQAGHVEVRLDLAVPSYVAGSFSLRGGLYEALEPERPADDRLGEVMVARPQKPREAVGFPRCAVRPLGGSPAVYVDGRPLPLFCFAVADSEADLREKTRHTEMAEVGVRIFSDWFGSSVDGYLGHLPPQQRQPGKEYDYTAFDAYFLRTLEEAPGALFLPHLYVTPPAWWQAAHPEELCVFHDGSRGQQSFASQRWREEIGGDLVRLIAHLRQAPYAHRLLGLVICSGYTAEWQTWGLWQDQFADFSAPAVVAWRQWLRAKYGDDAALRQAWGRAEVSLASAQPPSPQRRTEAACFMLRDPARDQDVLDYLSFLNDLTADALIYFARLAKQASGGRLLVGTYYGYLTQHHYHQAESGHCGLESVLAAPEIDFLMSPPLYTERQVGGVSGFMSVVDSVHRHGKIWLSEADYRTHLAGAAAGFGQTSTVEESLNVLWREFAHVLCKRAGVSWFDMGQGWLSGPDLPPALGKMQRVMADYLLRRQPWHGEVAVFIDPHSFYYVRPDAQLCPQLTLYPVVNLLRAGAPCDLYVLSDLLRPDLPEYKLYVFLNAYALDSNTRAAIEQRTRRAGVTALWHWAAGYAWPEQQRRATEAEMSRLVGLRLREVEAIQALRLAPTAPAPAYQARLAALDPSLPLGNPKANPAVTLGPVFVPAEGEVLATLEAVGPAGAPSLAGQAALAKGKVGAAQVFYSVLPCLPPTILRQIYLDAGVHLYLDSDDCLYADNGWVGIHALTAGERILRLPRPAALEAIRLGRIFPPGEVRLYLAQHQTELLAVAPGAKGAK
jgi:hypothetical protein